MGIAGIVHQNEKQLFVTSITIVAMVIFMFYLISKYGDKGTSIAFVTTIVVSLFLRLFLFKKLK